MCRSVLPSSQAGKGRSEGRFHGSCFSESLMSSPTAGFFRENNCLKVLNQKLLVPWAAKSSGTPLFLSTNFASPKRLSPRICRSTLVGGFHSYNRPRVVPSLILEILRGGPIVRTRCIICSRFRKFFCPSSHTRLGSPTRLRSCASTGRSSLART